MRERQRKKLPVPVHVEPGDHLICKIRDRKTGKVHQHTEEIGRTMVVDTIVTFDLDEPALGLEAGGIGAVFGKAAQ